jgi:hypothetical protein
MGVIDQNHNIMKLPGSEPAERSQIEKGSQFEKKIRIWQTNSTRETARGMEKIRIK